MQTEILPATPEPRETPAIPAPYPGFEKDMADHDARAQSIKNANATALPGPMRDAFGALKTDVVKEAENLGIKLIPITAGHIAILSEIKSPLIKIVRLYAESENENDRQEKINSLGEIPDSAAAELLYTFTQPPPALRASSAPPGRHAGPAAPAAAAAPLPPPRGPAPGRGRATPAPCRPARPVRPAGSGHRPKAPLHPA